MTLIAGTTTLASARSGPRGGFRLRARAPEAGRYRIAVSAGGETRVLGVLRVRPLVLAAVGDVTFGNGVGETIDAYGPRYPWRSVAPVLRRADLAVANLEGVVSTRGPPWPGKLFHFRGPPAALAAARRYAGIDVVSLANNHSLDFGRAAFLDTIRYASRFGVATVGGGRDLADSRRPAILHVGGLRIAFLGYSDVRYPGFDAEAGVPGATPALPDLIAADVRAARRRADLTVVYFHWGIERTFAPNARQLELAEISFDAGATVVLGTHAHVLQPIERPARRKLVAWSLGNFVFQETTPGTEQTGILLIRLGRGGVLRHTFRRAQIVDGQPRLLR